MNEEYTLDKYLADCEETLGLQLRLFDEYQTDAARLQKRVAEATQKLDALKENLRYLKQDAPVVTLYGAFHQRGQYLELQPQIEKARSALLEAKDSYIKSVAEVDNAGKSVEVLKKRLEIARNAKSNDTNGKLIDARHRFQKPHDDSGSEAEN